MRARGAVIHEVGGKWEVQDLEVDEPGDNEVRVKVMASGLCHSDDHFVTGDLTVDLPMVGGHEGSGIVEQVGSKVTGSSPATTSRLCSYPLAGRAATAPRASSTSVTTEPAWSTAGRWTAPPASMPPTAPTSAA